MRRRRGRSRDPFGRRAGTFACGRYALRVALRPAGRRGHTSRSTLPARGRKVNGARRRSGSENDFQSTTRSAGPRRRDVRGARSIVALVATRRGRAPPREARPRRRGVFARRRSVDGLAPSFRPACPLSCRPRLTRARRTLIEPLATASELQAASTRARRFLYEASAPSRLELIRVRAAGGHRWYASRVSRGRLGGRARLARRTLAHGSPRRACARCEDIFGGQGMSS